MKLNGSGESEKTNPISKMPKMNVNLYIIEDYENEPPSGPKKTNPIQTQFQTPTEPVSPFGSVG
jgi:hypothetical protein